MRIVCAPDSFKESMTAVDAAAAMARGVRRAVPDAECLELPLADGGEGTCRTVVTALGGEFVAVPAHDALGRPITAEFGFVRKAGVAVIEVAAACGLEGIAPAERNPLLATSFGVGEVVRAALDLGARHLVIGLGGTATNDAGAGMLTALGATFMDADGERLPPGGAALARLATVRLDGLDPRLAGCRVELACDVTNPLLGDAGASAVFGPQKGAGPAAVQLLEAALTRWADVLEPTAGVAVRNRPGAGAAGGLGAGFLACTPAELVPGVELVMRSVGFRELVRGADFVFTGEGSVDLQSRAGKVPLQVALAAAELGVRTVVFGGRIDDSLETESISPVLAYVPIVRSVSTIEQALGDGQKNLELAVTLCCRLLLA